MSSTAPDTLLAYCRPGFEGDLASELTERAGALGYASYCRAPNNQAYLTCHLVDGQAASLWQALAWRELVFARQHMLELARLTELPASDRATPIATAIGDRLSGVSQLWLEHPDTNDGKQLSRFCRRFSGPLRRALDQQGISVNESDGARLHLFFTDSAAVRIAISDPRNSAPWHQGIPRLRMPANAPSRSTLKLDEAIQAFLSGADQRSWLGPGKTAVDLGAAPGGWTWQLVQRSMRVTAVDNADIDPRLLESGLVEHVAADGFGYRPPQPVDWLVCDIVEQPERVLRLLLEWLEDGNCGGIIANLKLPMKRRHETVSDALARLRASPVAGMRRIGAKQLYHDREEVTVFVSLPQ